MFLIASNNVVNFGTVSAPKGSAEFATAGTVLRYRRSRPGFLAPRAYQLSPSFVTGRAILYCADATPCDASEMRGEPRSQNEVQQAEPVGSDLVIGQLHTDLLARYSNVARFQTTGANGPDMLPSLHDAALPRMGSNGLVLSGIEVVDGVAYAQSWWCRPADQTGVGPALDTLHVTIYIELHVTKESMMAITLRERVRTHRENLRAAGLRPIQIWVPDTRAPGFAEECARQSRIIAESGAEDDDLDFIEKAADLGAWE